ncbi:hypothetical protein QAD02_006657 [Eretmocerus hayati]|uniref:Uncharacterized protein n=1 Tax=Eretmocerus hayati TaxID=131215 RepID=A0ACC2N5S0_9HYME|nr:hypothetical protein QAD02_006657 [Eretmocerus hayati]
MICHNRRTYIWILLFYFASNALLTEVHGYKKAVKYLHKWQIPQNITDECKKFHLVQSHGVILKICTQANEADKTRAHPFTTYIDSIDPQDDQVSCTIPNFLANKVTVFESGHKLLMQDYHQILIVDRNSCIFETATIKAHAIVPQDVFFDVITISSVQYEEEILFKGLLSVKRYDDEGKFITEFPNITRQRGELFHQGYFIDEPTWSVKYFLIQDVSKFSNRWGVVEIFDNSYLKVESASIELYPKSYSVAHNNFSICYEENGLKCVLYDENFKSMYHMNVTNNDSNELDNYHFVSMHNLLGGGSIVMFCEKINDTNTCRLFSAIIDERGLLFTAQYFEIESLYADGSYSDPFLMDINSDFKPQIFELNAEHGIYCLVFPNEGMIHGLGITVKKF